MNGKTLTLQDKTRHGQMITAIRKERQPQHKPEQTKDKTVTETQRQSEIVTKEQESDEEETDKIAAQR